MRFVQSELIEVRSAGSKGRGVFARMDIAKSTIIETVPVILLRVGEVFGDLKSSELSSYVFTWSRDKVAVSLGYGSMYNHSYKPNAVYECRDNRTQVFKARRNIEKGEEITVNYNAEPGSRSSLWFDVKSK